MRFTDQIPLRDPFILPWADEGTYYLYGTTDAQPWEGPGTGFDVYRSRDLARWDGPFPAFRPPVGFWADRNFWAPEAHRWGNRVVLLASFKAPGRCRGTQVLVADSPIGPFVPLTDGPVTPPDWECLDGTLLVDAGNPWLVFCREWLQVVDGEVYAQPLAQDLTHPVGAPTRLFRASDAPWTAGADHNFGSPEVPRVGVRYVTDGPFVHRLPDGSLAMLWSSHGADGYALGIARSASGAILGPWVHQSEPLFRQDGGHGMLFRRFDGALTLTLHAPNTTPLERAQFFEVKEDLTSALPLKISALPI